MVLVVTEVGGIQLTAQMWAYKQEFDRLEGMSFALVIVSGSSCANRCGMVKISKMGDGANEPMTG